MIFNVGYLHMHKCITSVNNCFFFNTKKTYLSIIWFRKMMYMLKHYVVLYVVL